MCHYCHKISPLYFEEIADYIICDDCCSKDICQKCGVEIGKNEEQFEGDDISSYHVVLTAPNNASIIMRTKSLGE